MKEGSHVGPFTIGPKLGEGGMATVFLAEHNSDNTRVALKVLRTEIVSDPSFIEAFGHEVRAAARLDHDRITAVFDHGVISPSEAVHNPELSGAPWLAMELVEGGTISPLAGKIPWPYLQRITLDLLDSLAHAHARGMVHRDIKPGNILLDQKTGRIKLTDFGLVLFGNESEKNPAVDENISGTPSFMAPEQIRCDWQNYGPWTDLYSVGATVWSLATGRPPYVGAIRDVLTMHINGMLPEFDPPFPMPLALLDWLEAMMEVDTKHRFRRAADAAWALSQIKHDTQYDGSSGVESISELQDFATMDLSAQPNLETLVLASDDTLKDADTATMEHPHLDPASEDSAYVGHSIVQQTPPFPKDWGRGRRMRSHLHGAGLALFGLRATGVIGQYEERDRMWSAMRSVAKENQARLLLLEGASGSGKSTLAEWFCTRVHEVGGGHWLAAHHSEDGGSGNGISDLLVRSLKTAGVDRATAVEQVRTHLKQLAHSPIDDAIGLVQLSDPLGESEGSAGLGVHFSSPEEKCALLERYFRTISQPRPLIIWMDDLHHSSESQALVRYLLDAADGAPILLIGTVPTEAVIEGSELEQRLSDLLSHERAEAIHLQPLDREGQIALIRDLLGLDPRLATRVEAKCGGNPQFAVQLVSDWVERGLLIPSPTGFLLDEGHDVVIPQDMLAVWKQRLDAAFEPHTSQEQHAIEIGAILGDKVDRGEWKDALDLAGLQTPHALMSELLRLRLVVRKHQHGDWSFVHGMFRAAILAHAEENGRTTQWSSMCADVIPDRPLDIARKARLLVASNRTKEALRPLHYAVSKELLNGDWGRALELGHLRTRIVEGVAIDPDGVHALDTEITNLYLIKGKARTKHILSNAPSLIEWANRLEEWDSSAQLYLSLGSQKLFGGESEEGREHVLAALSLAQEHRLKRIVEVLNRLCFVSIRMGDLDSAHGYAREATLAAESWGDTLGVARGYTMMSRVQWQSGDLKTAAFFVGEAAIRFERIGSMRGLAEVWNTRGELARERGDLEAAEVAYREANARYENCGSPDSMFAKLNLGSTYVKGRKFKEAREILDRIETRLKRNNRINILLVTQLVRVNCFIHDKDWRRVEEDLDRIAPHLDQIGLYDSDIASSAKLSAVACEEVGQPELARKAWQIVHSQLTALGRHEEANEAKGKLEITAQA